MIIEGVDPRDVEWEVDQPVYRVYFWHQPPSPPAIRQQDMGYYCEERRILGAADVHQVLDWATATRGEARTFTLYVEHVHEGSTGLLHLAGRDPTDSSALEPPRAVS